MDCVPTNFALLMYLVFQSRNYVVREDHLTSVKSFPYKFDKDLWTGALYSLLFHSFQAPQCAWQLATLFGRSELYISLESRKESRDWKSYIVGHSKGLWKMWDMLLKRREWDKVNADTVYRVLECENAKRASSPDIVEELTAHCGFPSRTIKTAVSG